MNKNAITKTAICHYDKKKDCFIVQSPLFDRCLGVAETEQEAWKIFSELLNDYYIAYLEGKLVGYDKRGRPAKGYVELHALVKPSIKSEIATRAKELGISQGELIEYLCHLQKIKEKFEEQQVSLKKKFKDNLQSAKQRIQKDKYKVA